MEKDPAYLFYSKDWLEGTAEMLPQEKGVFVDLLCHQHQKGSLPKDEDTLRRLTRLERKEFDKIWNTLKSKFVEIDGRLYNKKMSTVMGDRSERAWTNKIIGTFGSICKKSDANHFDILKIKKDFIWSDFKYCESERLTERLTEWFNNRLAFLADANANANNNNTIPVFDNNANFGKSISESSDRMLNITRLFRLNGLKDSRENILHMLRVFIAEISAKQDIKKDVDELQSHFISWTKYNKSSQLQSKSRIGL